MQIIKRIINYGEQERSGIGGKLRRWLGWRDGREQLTRKNTSSVMKYSLTDVRALGPNTSLVSTGNQNYPEATQASAAYREGQLLFCIIHLISS